MIDEDDEIEQINQNNHIAVKKEHKEIIDPYNNNDHEQTKSKRMKHDIVS